MPVYKDPNIKKNPWYYAFEVRDKETGKRKTIKKRGFKRKQDAELAEAEARLAWEKGTIGNGSSIKFGEFIWEFIKKKHNLSGQTRYNNENHIKTHIEPYLGHYKLNEINVSVLEDFIEKLNEKGLAESTCGKIFSIVNSALKSAAKRGLIVQNPVDLLEYKPRMTKRRVDYWTVDEVNKFLNGFEHRQKIVFELAIYTGMRLGEILGLPISNIDLKAKKIYIRQVLTFDGKIKMGAKTESGNRSITIPDILIDKLRKHIEMIENEMKRYGENYNKEKLLVCSVKGTPLTIPNLRRLWYRLLEETGSRKIRFHDLRHTCASLLLSVGAHPKVVQELLGHSSIKITMDLYSHLMPNMHSEAINKLGELINSYSQE